MRNNKGFTLPETLLSMVIFAVLAAVAGSVIVISLDLLGRYGQISRAQLVSDGVCGYLADRLSYGADIMIAGDPDDGYTGHAPMLVEVTEDGRIYAGSFEDSDNIVSVFSDEFYGGMTVELYISRDIEKTNVIEIYADVYRDGSLLCSTVRTVRTMNCETPLFAGVISNYAGNIYLMYSGIGGDADEQPIEQTAG